MPPGLYWLWKVVRSKLGPNRKPWALPKRRRLLWNRYACMAGGYNLQLSICGITTIVARPPVNSNGCKFGKLRVDRRLKWVYPS
jgi:hypothetical protein